jgi:hypothetical protein
LMQTLAIGLRKELGEGDKDMPRKWFQHRCGMVGHHLNPVLKEVQSSNLQGSPPKQFTSKS